MTTHTIPNHVEYGDPEIAFTNQILRSAVGSEVHGTALEGTSDRDEMGVFIAPPEHFLGIRDYRHDYIRRSVAEGERSGAGDLDLTMYSLGKYLRLAIKGNPTILLPLFAPTESLVVVTPLGEELREMRSAFLSQQAVERFLGYMHSQHMRMLGQSRRNVPNRPELIEQYGWDVKYGSHALRLAYQGYELASEGTLSLPMREPQRERVLAVKRGEVSQAEVSEEIAHWEQQVRLILDDDFSPLPVRPDIDRIEAWAITAQRRHWGWA